MLGSTGFDGAEADPVPNPLVALTVKVYVAPSVSPVTVAVVSLAGTVVLRADCAVDAIYGVTV